MKLPNVISLFLLSTLFFAIQWILGHIGQFSIPAEYITTVSGLLSVALTAVGTMIQQRTPEAAPRSISEAPRPSYWARVLYK